MTIFDPDDELEAEVDVNAWTSTFADAMTLLLGFFVLVYSLNTMDAERLEEVRDAIAPHSMVEQILPDKADDTRAGPHIVAQLTAPLQEFVNLGEVTAVPLPRGVRMNLTDDFVFEGDGVEINAAVRKNLATLVWELKQPGLNDFLLEVQVLDSWDRSRARTNALVDYLVQQGFPVNRVRGVTFGTTTPQMRRTRGGSPPSSGGPTIQLILERP